jgi:uncharacterized damage-inducible protein DinB
MDDSGLNILRKTSLTLLNELIDGSAKDFCWILNPSDSGLLRSLDKLSSQAASALPPSGGASIAAHVDHLRYGFNLMNRAFRGEDAFADADFSASWRRQTVSEERWVELRDELRSEIQAWRESIQEPRNISEFEATGMIASVAHLAYHIGAIRQIDRSIRGPSAFD